MNKKGFTLVELLAVIVILALLAVLASTSVTKVVKNSKSDLYNAQIESIESAAETWGADNLNILPSGDSCKYITLRNLKEYGLIDANITNPKTNKKFSDDMKIKIVSKTTNYGIPIIEYEVNTNNISSCENVYPFICKRVTNTTKTAGNVPEGTFKNGDEYICEVTPGMEEGYHFFVVSSTEKHVNLIMDRNMCSDGTPTVSNHGACYTAWQASGLSTDGPVTAMDYLYNSTKNWSNIPNIEMNYTDEGNSGDYGYGKIVTENGITRITKKDGTAVKVLTDQEGYTNLKARMPYQSEVSDIDATTVYLYENFDSCYWTGEESIKPTNYISGEHAYWTLSSDLDSDNGAGFVFGAGYAAFSLGGLDNTYDTGVRPVISIPKYNME